MATTYEQPDGAAILHQPLRPAETVYLTSVTLAELLFGSAALPSRRRRALLSQTLGDNSAG